MLPCNQQFNECNILTEPALITIYHPELLEKNKNQDGLWFLMFI